MSSLVLSMSAFALAASITPGPVNLVALSTGVRFGWRASLPHVSGATLGFCLLLLLIGLGLHQLLARWPLLVAGLQAFGIAFLLYMAYQLSRADGQLAIGQRPRPPGLLSGAVMQWLNPKAWLAAVAGMGAYTASGQSELVWQFTGLYFLICYPSIACWALAGSFLRRHVQQPARLRWFNRSMAALLVLSAAFLLRV